MSDTTPNLSTRNARTPSNQRPNASTHPPSAVAVTQTQSEHDNSIGIDILLAASEMTHDEVYDETLLAQTPLLNHQLNPSLLLPLNPPRNLFAYLKQTCLGLLLIANIFT